MGPALDKVGEQVGQVVLRVDAVQLACFHQGGEVGPAAPAVIAAGEQGVLAAEDQGPDGALDGVVIRYV